MSFAKKVRFRLEYFGLWMLTTSVHRMPFKGAHALGKMLADLAYHFDKRGRETAHQNLAVTFTDKSPDEIEQIARDSYRNFTRTVIDQLRSRKLTQENYLDHVTLVMEDEEAMVNAQETGAIWVTPHYSNFEWIALIMGFRGCKFTVIAQDFKNPSLTELYKKNREVSGHTVIPQKNALIKLLRALKSGGHAAFLTDLTIPPSKAATVIECFGRKTCVTAIHADLLKRTKLPVIPGIAIPLADGRYEMRGYRPLTFDEDATPQEIAQACWDVFEPTIRENPAPWLWMYKHWRYLPDAESSDNFPAYAHASVKFEEIVAKNTSSTST